MAKNSGFSRKNKRKIERRSKAVNDKMREALLIIAGGKDARGNYEEVAWHMAQLAAEALAAEGGASSYSSMSVSPTAIKPTSSATSKPTSLKE